MGGSSPINRFPPIDAFDAACQAFYNEAMDIKVVMQQGRPTVRDVVKLLDQAERNPRLYNYFGMYKTAWTALLRIMKEGKGTGGEIGPALKAFGHYIRNHVTDPHWIQDPLSREMTVLQETMKLKPYARVTEGPAHLRKLHGQLQFLYRAMDTMSRSTHRALYSAQEALSRIDALKQAATSTVQQGFNGARAMVQRPESKPAAAGGIGFYASIKLIAKHPGAGIRGFCEAIRASRTVATAAKNPAVAAVVAGTVAAGVAHFSGLDDSKNPVVRGLGTNIFGHLRDLNVFSLKTFVQGIFKK